MPKNVVCKKCNNLVNDWCEKVIDSPDPDMQRDCQHFCEKTNGVTIQELDGCKYCKEYEDLPEHFINGKPAGKIFDTCIQTDENGRWHLEVPSGVDIGIKFCPMCGRKLPQPPKGE